MAIRLRSMGRGLRIRSGTFTPIHFQKNPGTAAAAGYGSSGNRFILFFFAGLLAGTAAANFLHASLSDQAGYYLNLLSHQSDLGRSEQLALFGDICRQRIIEVLIAWLIGLTAYAVPCFCVLSAGFGLSVGVVLSVMTGLKGILGLPFFSCECDAAGISICPGLVSAAVVGNTEKRQAENSGPASGTGLCCGRQCLRG
ncbi:MAG: stage II sporulation protein M, partial [Clostridiaceae bacterium]|nr:stage II sporulation protein M [Clostridiaceae bacterium]